MARRYSGQLQIDLRWKDSPGEYACTVRKLGNSDYRYCVRVGMPVQYVGAVDAPLSHDYAARGAVSFMLADAEAYRGAMRNFRTDCGEGSEAAYMLADNERYDDVGTIEIARRGERMG